MVRGRSATILSDGREIIYYSSSPAPPPAPPDRRGLAARARRSTLRYDRLQDAWVIYAAHRQDRSLLPADDQCPLCPSSSERLTEIPAHDYEVVVFENRYPALGADGRGAPADAGDVLAEVPAGGRCEVICYTADHDGTFAALSEERVGLVLAALIDRSVALGRRDDVEQVFCFENRGREIGVTQNHPHGQIYAYPYVAPRLQRAITAAHRHRERTGRNLYDDLCAAERADGRRLVLERAHWTAFVPFAARWPYEVHCYPNERVPDLAALGPDALEELPGVLLDLFGRFARLFSVPAPYIAAWHQAPVHEARDLVACHLELFTSRRADDKLKYLAGSESAMDAFTNDILPEAAAERLRALGGRARPPAVR